MSRADEKALFCALMCKTNAREYIATLPEKLQKPAWRTLGKWDHQGFVEYGTSIGSSPTTTRSSLSVWASACLCTSPCQR
jgi:hypothetical protein